MPRRHRSPQEKKKLSLDRDHPLSTKFPKALRKHWPQRVASAQRSFRHASKQALATEHDPADVHRPVVRKWGTGAHLADVIAEKKARRAKLAAEPRKSPEARTRRAKRRGKPVVEDKATSRASAAISQRGKPRTASPRDK